VANEHTNGTTSPFGQSAEPTLPFDGPVESPSVEAPPAPPACRYETYPNRKAWLAARRPAHPGGGFLGASEVLALMLPNQYRSPIGVYAAKVGRVLPDSTEWSSDTHARWVGRWSEPFIREYVYERYGVKVLHPEGDVHLVARDVNKPWRAVTPDGFIDMGMGDGNPGCEMKMRHSLGAGFPTVPIGDVYDLHGDSPFWSTPVQSQYEQKDRGKLLEYFSQCQYSMAITGAPCWYLIVSLNFQDIRMFRVHPDPEGQAVLLKIADEFWANHVLTRTPPPVSKDTPEQDKQALFLLETDAKGVAVADDPGQFEALQFAYKRLAKEARDAKAGADTIKNQFHRAMNGGRTIRYGNAEAYLTSTNQLKFRSVK